MGILTTFIAGFAGVALGAFLARRNQKRAASEQLLVEALNDMVSAIAEVAGGAGQEAQRRYASAVSRIAVHAPASVVVAFRKFQDDPTTTTAKGRAQLVSAVQEARQELGHGTAANEDLHVLMFGGTTPSEAATD